MPHPAVVVVIPVELATVRMSFLHATVPPASAEILNFATVIAPVESTVVGSARSVMVGFVLKTYCAVPENAVLLYAVEPVEVKYFVLECDTAALSEVVAKPVPMAPKFAYTSIIFDPLYGTVTVRPVAVAAVSFIATRFNSVPPSLKTSSEIAAAFAVEPTVTPMSVKVKMSFDEVYFSVNTFGIERPTTFAAIGDDASFATVSVPVPTVIVWPATAEDVTALPAVADVPETVSVPAVNSFAAMSVERFA